MNVPRCASCGSPLPADAPRSSCPVCLLRAGLDGASAATGYRPLGESMEGVAGSPATAKVRRSAPDVALEGLPNIPMPPRSNGSV